MSARASAPATENATKVPAERSGTGEVYELDLFVIHHKSGRYNNYWREKESAALVDIVQGLQSGAEERNVAILGDFNATPDAKSVRTYIDAAQKNHELWRAFYERARIPDDIVAALQDLPPLRIVVLSEDWCGDAVNTVPLIARMAESAPDIDLRGRRIVAAWAQQLVPQLVERGLVAP